MFISLWGADKFYMGFIIFLVGVYKSLKLNWVGKSFEGVDAYLSGADHGLRHNTKNLIEIVIISLITNTFVGIIDQSSVWKKIIFKNSNLGLLDTI